MVGLTLGKFAPFHKGHGFVIASALAEMDKVIVLVYDSPSTTNIPLTVRARWIEHIFPDVKIIKGYGSPEDVGMSNKIMKLQEDYILSVLNGQKIDAFYSSELYGGHVSNALGCRNVEVDVARKKFPISGTEIRQDPYLYRDFIHPHVYRDLITKVLFLGAPSTGKTTIAKRMACEYNTVWMPEYGAEYWYAHQKNNRLTIEDLEQIVVGHNKREHDLLQNANRYLFTDTSALTTYLFSLYYHGESSTQIRLFVELQKYDVVFLCDEDIPYEDTWDRSGEANRHMFQRMYYDELAVRRIPFILLSGDIETRVAKVKEVLNGC